MTRYTVVSVVAAALSPVGGALGFVVPLPPSTTMCSSARTQVRMTTTEVETNRYTIDGKEIGGPLTPIFNSILVRVRDKDGVSMGGVIIPDKSQEKPTEGEVVAVGPGKTHPETGIPVPLPCEVGDKVLYGEYDGTPVKYNGADHQFIRDDNILFVFSGERMASDTIKMISDQVLVKLDPEVTESSSGLLLAPKEDTGTGSTTGEVAAVGPGRITSRGEVVPMSVAVGDLVKTRNFAGSPVKLQGVDYRVMKNAEILAKW